LPADGAEQLWFRHEHGVKPRERPDALGNAIAEIADWVEARDGDVACFARAERAVIEGGEREGEPLRR
jgi:hypothetical protein